MSLIESLATTLELAEVFSDDSVLQAMLLFETALAQAEAEVGVIPESAAQAVAEAARGSFDLAALAARSLRAGTLTIPLVKALRERAPYVHWGATSQDVSDTAMVLLLRRARAILAADHAHLERALRTASGKYADAVMLGRTLLQAAPPITFGLKVAGWYGALRRSWTRVEAAFHEALMLQFGGASGTLAALGEHGIAVSAALACRLELRNPEAPWHSHRDRLASLICSLGVYTGSLAKMARDVSLLMQNEVAEASEPGGDGRGGSSTMPHKHNPTACSLTLAAANRVPGLVASYLAGMVQEHERATGSWQAEWATIARVVQDTGLALASMREVAEGLTVDAVKMRANIDATRGAIFAERAMMKSGQTLAETLPEIPDKPEEYLGAAETFRKQLLES
jgi:3-carboxy-cis,cis-muconate cycloisomerase